MRRLKPHKRLERLTRRADFELAWASDEPLIGGALILDTSVYLDVLQARTPDAVDELLTYRVCHHSAVCLAELTHVFGRLDPAHPSTSGVLQTVRDVIKTFRSIACKLQIRQCGAKRNACGRALSSQRRAEGCGHQRKYLNDALIYLQARGIGASILAGCSATSTS